MAEDNIWTKVTTHKLTGQTSVALFDEGCNFMASKFGLSLYEKIDDFTRNYAFGATGLGVKIIGGDHTTWSGVQGHFTYKDSNGVFQEFRQGFVDVRFVKDYNLVYERTNLNGVIVHRIRPENISSEAYFSKISVTDYFSSETRSCILDGSTILSYNPIDHLYEMFNLITIGNETYPSKRILSVAAPVILESPTFYGYVNDSTLYRIKSGIEKVQIGGKYTETLLDGRKFKHIGDRYHFL